jgi:hypothetical protein
MTSWDVGVRTSVTSGATLVYRSGPVARVRSAEAGSHHYLFGHGRSNIRGIIRDS